jgi:hypothetical protein
VVSIKDAILSDVRGITVEILKVNVYAIKSLQSYVGKLMHIASLIYMLRPFLNDMYAAIHSTQPSNAPRGCIWTDQIRHAIQWIAAFLGQTMGKLERRYTLASYVGEGLSVELNLDASPWGLGAFLSIGQEIVAWFAAPLGDEELEALELTRGSCEAQQALEALAALVALRAWAEYWRSTRVLLRIRSDSVSALILVLKLKTTGKAAVVIARELALDIALGNYQPLAMEHVPGIANSVADMLSRKHDPTKDYVLPTVLANVPETKLPARGRGYYRTLRHPA